ncbi:MAG TPA: proprotein convertase P-domain-containing protein, partial [Gemmataceae bacterium]|nr:proprotein convertase P-domain-containing protein [Gemmataceae bacterium]
MTPLVPRAFRRVPTRRTPPKVRGRRRPLSVQDLDERIVPSAPPAPLGFTSTLTSFTNNTAVSITSTGTPTVTSTINVSGVGTYLHDLDLTTFLKHTFPGDLDITLTSPAGTIVTITSDNGASNDDVFNGTLWDDDADPGNPAPFPGDTFPGSFLATDTAYTLGILKPALTPEEPLSAFRGENPNGTWTLTVSDDANADGGSLDQWTLGVSTLNASPTAQAPATFTNSTAAPISATGTPTVTSSIVVSGAPLSLQKLTLRTFITHTNASNLDITLTSPSGTSVTLTSDNGGTNDDVFNGTLWDDDADPGNPAPFPPSNTFAASNMVTDTTYTNLTVKATLTPEESLAAFIGENPNGTWTLTVSDDTNSDGGSLASWELGITGFELGPIPAAIATSPGVTTGGGTSHPVTVTFVDDSGINVATVIGNNAALQVNGPNGFSAPLTYVSIDNSGNGSPRVATYSFTPPGGSWDGIDSGTYTISVLANQVADVDGGFIPAGSVGSFVVAIPNFTVFNDADSGFGSLRQVIGDANAVPGPDTIVFDPGFFNTPRTISLLSALPTIVGPLTIPGTGAANLTVRRDPSASGNFRVFDSTASALTISGMTISGGNAATGGGLQANAAGTTINLSGVTFTGNTATTNGGALHVTGTNANVTVINSLFDTNTVTGTGNGGAVFMNSGTFLTVRNSTLSGNTAAADGGALYFFSGGGLTVENSTISGNTASGTVVGGGALYFFGTASSSPPAGAGFTPGTVVIRNSTLANNNSAANGGAVAMPSFAGTLLLQNSTLTGNTAALSGGAAVVTTGSGSIVVQGSTVVNNTSNASAANTGGGGVARISTTPGSITVVNSVVSGNINANGPDILSVTGTTVNANFSAIGSNTGFTLSGTSGNNLAFGVDPQLGALANNGG